MFKWLGGLVDSNEKEIKRLEPFVDRINKLEPEFEKLSEAELRAKTEEFKARFRDGVTLDDLLPEAFAAVREAARRTIGQRHYDVQLLGGVVLHQGKIAEMKTGEGKTLVATLPLYLNSLAGKGAHLVTVNDYLARRDPYWMGPIYHALGVSVASIYPQQNPSEHTPSRIYDPSFDSGEAYWKHFRPVSRKEAYQADITYGTCAEFGFDYLRDNMVMDLSGCVQRSVNYAIVDEVDNLLVDEARTPLIISGPAQEASQRYQVFARLVPRLSLQEDYEIQEKERTATLTDDGIAKMEEMLKREGVLKAQSLYDPSNYFLTRYLENALKAHVLYRRDRDYVVKDGQIIIVDEFTGRLMYGRRYSEGLHQALEAKEHVKVQQETMTFATITIQNYFRMYEKLAGMTGTAMTEAEEFHKIYKLEVTALPTNVEYRATQGELQIISRRDNGVEVTTYENQKTGEHYEKRVDFPDRIYRDEKAKFKAVVNEIEQLNKEGRPILVGTVSIEKSELLSDALTRKGIAHQVLNAKNHEKEATIIAQAGQPGAVTVATNMAGRGVDIVLGGKEPDGGTDKDRQEWQERHDQIIRTGGLHVVGTERHEARRIDNQLRGRSGRQGDPGSTRFYVSLEDDIVHRFGGDRIKGFMKWAGMDEDTPIENALLDRAITDVQKRVEGYHFDIRKNLVEYDDVVNKHRELIYREREKILGGADLKTNILNMLGDEMRSAVASRLPDEHGTNWDVGNLIADVTAVMPLPPQMTAEALSKMSRKEIEERFIQLAEALYEEKEKQFGPENMRLLERLVMLRVIDTLWVEHLTAMENMRQGAGWQTMRQEKAVDAYKRMGYEQFQVLQSTIQHDMTHAIFHVNIVKKEASTPVTQVAKAQTDAGKPGKPGSRKIGRNEPCPCGSGKKYKHCHGR